MPALEVLGGLVFAAILAYGGYQATRGQITVGAFMAFFAAMLMAYQPMRRIANLNLGLQQGLAAAERVFHIVDYSRAIEEVQDATPLAVTGGHVRLEDVAFSYGGDIPTLAGITLDAPPGMVVALVGVEATLKRYYPEGDTVRLQPANPEMEPIRVPASDVQVQGVVVGLMRKF